MSGIALETYRSWRSDRCAGLGAGLAFYAVLAVPSFFTLVILIFLKTRGIGAVQSEVVPFLRGWLDPRWVSLIEYLVVEVKKFGLQGSAVTVPGVLTLVLGMGGFPSQLRDSIQTIWGTRTNPATFKAFMVEQFWALFLSLLLALAFGLSLHVRISTQALTGFGLRAADLSLSAIWIGAVSAVLFRLTPAAPPTWRAILPGAAMTGVLMALGRLFSDLYLAKQDFGNLSDMTGTVFAFLLLAYYFSQVFLIGAELTHVLCLRSSTRRLRFLHLASDDSLNLTKRRTR